MSYGEQSSALERLRALKHQDDPPPARSGRIEATLATRPEPIKVVPDVVLVDDEGQPRRANTPPRGGYLWTHEEFCRRIGNGL